MVLAVCSCTDCDQQSDAVLQDGTLAQENTALLRSVPPPALAYPPFIVPGSGVDVFDQYRWKEAIFVGPTRHSRYLPSALVCCK